MRKGFKLSKSVPVKQQTHLNFGWPQAEYISSNLSFLGELFLEEKMNE